MKNFALTGAAGYIAPRHLKAIKETNNNLVAILDKSDSVGIIDNYFPNAFFFSEFERFERHINKLQHSNNKVDYISICAPNYLHDSHIRFALRSGADAICEKPLVLNPWNADALLEIEKETSRKTNVILQLRLHQSIINLKKEVDKNKNKMYDIDLTYITSRGNWYFKSWKSDIEKSGGIATNIGIHFFDMLTWIFGNVKQNSTHISKNDKAAGLLQLERANIRWFLSLDYNDIPTEIKQKNQRTYRSIKVDNNEIEFSGGFTDLHTLSYIEILKGNGFSIKDAKSSIDVVQKIRTAEPIGIKGDYHPFVKR